MQNLSHKIKTVRALAPQAAGATDVQSSIIDMAGYDGIRFIVSFGAIVTGAATSVKVQQNTANSASGMADLEGTSITVADTDDNTLVIAEINRPQERYVRCYISRATQNSTVDLVVAELYGPKKLPITDDATVSHVEVHSSPDEGTA